MYDKLLKEIEDWIFSGHTLSDEAYKTHLDLIIKIKTIQAMDVSAELIRESRHVLTKSGTY